MPIPTPPKTKLFVIASVKKPQKKGLRADSRKLDTHIKQLTTDLATSLDIPEEVKNDVFNHHDGETSQQYSDRLDQAKPKKKLFIPPEHLTQKPFRENDALRKLSYDLKKETDPKKPVKRAPRRERK